MWKYFKFRPVRGVKLRLILSGIALLLIIIMVVAMNSVLYSDKNKPRAITRADYESLETGQIVTGTIDHVEESYLDETTNNYIVLTDNKKLLVFRAPMNSYIDFAMRELMMGKRSSVEYKGKVTGLSEQSRSLLSMNALTLNVITSNNIQGNAYEYTTGHMVDITEKDSDGQFKILIGYSICCIFLLVVIFFLTRKIINNAIYTIGVEKGKIQPEIKIKKEDLVIENNTEYYSNEDNGEFFYVNTSHDIHAAGKSPDAPSSPAPKADKPDASLYYQSNVNDQGNFYVGSEDNNSNDRQEPFPGSNKSTNASEDGDKRFYHY